MPLGSPISAPGAERPSGPGHHEDTVIADHWRTSCTMAYSSCRHRPVGGFLRSGRLRVTVTTPGHAPR